MRRAYESSSRALHRAIGKCRTPRIPENTRGNARMHRHTAVALLRLANAIPRDAHVPRTITRDSSPPSSHTAMTHHRADQAKSESWLSDAQTQFSLLSLSFSISMHLSISLVALVKREHHRRRRPYHWRLFIYCPFYPAFRDIYRDMRRNNRHIRVLISFTRAHTHTHTHTRAIRASNRRAVVCAAGLSRITHCHLAAVYAVYH